MLNELATREYIQNFEDLTNALNAVKKAIQLSVQDETYTILYINCTWITFICFVPVSRLNGSSMINKIKNIKTQNEIHVGHFFMNAESSENNPFSNGVLPITVPKIKYPKYNNNRLF